MGIFSFSITKSPPKTVAELLRKAQKYMNAEDAVLAKEMKGKSKRDNGTSGNLVDPKFWANRREKEGTSGQEAKVH